MSEGLWKGVDVVPEDDRTPEQVADLAVIDEMIGDIRTLVNRYLENKGAPFSVASINFERSGGGIERHWLICKCTNEGDFCEWVDNH
ncbi:hypothetical protein [Ruegeria arenilitoris]|uniref:hypothetical protein n=1 Tax=Ruegeria arenilitoris TaxID=1173585 RepID=UPI00147BB583|nr:hypothetical protein [Ruegeria arenilitoris]